MDTYEMEQADKTMWQRYGDSPNARERAVASETHLDPADLVESKIDPSQFELADWPNTWHDFEVPCVPCAMCGHLLRWGVGFRHTNGDLIIVGEDCADYLDSENVVEKKMKEFKTAQKNKEEKLEAMRVFKTRRATMLADHEDVCEFLSKTIYDEVAYREAEKPTKLRAPMPFMMDMVHAYNKYGSLTENQISAVQKIMVKQAEWEAKKAAEPQPTTPLEAGRYVIEGEIISAKEQKSDFGWTWKMLVRMDDLNKVWGTVPASIEDESYTMDRPGDSMHDRLVGLRVQFTATVKPSEQDEHFGYFSIPKKGSIIHV